MKGSGELRNSAGDEFSNFDTFCGRGGAPERGPGAAHSDLRKERTSDVSSLSSGAQGSALPNYPEAQPRMASPSSNIAAAAESFVFGPSGYAAAFQGNGQHHTGVATDSFFSPSFLSSSAGGAIPPPPPPSELHAEGNRFPRAVNDGGGDPRTAASSAVAAAAAAAWRSTLYDSHAAQLLQAQQDHASALAAHQQQQAAALRSQNEASASQGKISASGLYVSGSPSSSSTCCPPPGGSNAALLHPAMAPSLQGEASRMLVALNQCSKVHSFTERRHMPERERLLRAFEVFSTSQLDEIVKLLFGDADASSRGDVLSASSQEGSSRRGTTSEPGPEGTIDSESVSHSLEEEDGISLTPSLALSSIQSISAKLVRKNAEEEMTIRATCAIYEAMMGRSGAESIPSIGSIHHAVGLCRPCSFQFSTKRPGGCKKGIACMFCHHAHPQQPTYSRGAKAKKASR